MKLMITGICGFVGSSLAREFREQHPDWTVCGIDNFTRPGSETNRRPLESSSACGLLQDGDRA